MRPPNSAVHRLSEYIARQPYVPHEVRCAMHELEQSAISGGDLRALREAANVTQVELARRLHVGQGRVSRIEHQDSVTPATRLAYLDALKEGAE